MAGICTFTQLVDDVVKRPGPVRLVGVDGLAGSGKTTFAGRLAAAGGGWPVVHTDDFATHEEPLAWWPRLLAQVVEPLLAGEPATFRPYDWVHRTWSDPVTVQPADVVVIEGVGATRRAWRDRLAVRVWVEAPRDLRLRRGLARDGADLAEFWAAWMAAEDRYVADDHPQRHADLVVAGDPQQPHEADGEFCVLSERRADDAPRTTRR